MSKTITCTAGALGTGTMAHALAASTITVADAHGTQYVKNVDGAWDVTFTLGALAQQMPGIITPLGFTPEQVQAALFRGHAAHTFVGSVLEGVTDKNACGKCSGTGRHPAIHVANGNCFGCSGSGRKAR